VAHAYGFADGERIPRSFAIETLQRIVDATDLPVTVDLEAGYGDTSDGVGDTIGLAIDAGAVGCNIEDSFPADGRLREISDQAARIQRARQIADAAKVGFFINARTDVFFQTVPEQHNDVVLARAIERAHAYANAGADGIFMPGLTDIRLISRLAQLSPIPLNIMIGDGSPTPRELAECGVSRVSYGPGPYLIAMKALEDAARATS
jgi:2-methylisocitrate lyase-like PEP mutase family enzyme